MKTLIVSVHPDDETLGCGGTMLKLKSMGHELFWLIMTDVRDEYGYSEEVIKRTNNGIKEVARAYGISEVRNIGLRPKHLHSIDFLDILEAVSRVVNEIKPDWVFSVNRSDIHTDHQVAAKAVASCTKSFRYPFIKRIYLYECLSETEASMALPENVFLPNAYSDISGFLEGKIEIMKMYPDEIQESPMPRSKEVISALAVYRGGSIGVKHAEAFMLIREVF